MAATPFPPTPRASAATTTRGERVHAANRGGLGVEEGERSGLGGGGLGLGCLVGLGFETRPKEGSRGERMERRLRRRKSRLAGRGSVYVFPEPNTYFVPIQVRRVARVKYGQNSFYH